VRPAGWAALVLAGAIGIQVLVTTYLVSWTTTGLLDDLTILLPVPVAFVCGLALRREVGLIACVWMAVTIELNQGYFNPFVLVVTLGPWLTGAVVRDHRQIVQRLDDVGRQLETESELVADEAVRLERAHIARELHDIVAHCVSVMVVQAYAGERLAITDQPSATAAFDHIASAAAQAKLEIAHLVDLLADDSTTEPDRKLTSQLQDLVAGAAATGLDVRLHVEGQLDQIKPETAVVVYRVVQESVTNALKHSPGAPIEIYLDCGSDIVIDVVNRLDPVSDSDLATVGGGHGLSGIRDRVSGLGGTFAAGPNPPGAWRVSVRFPRANQP